MKLVPRLGWTLASDPATAVPERLVPLLEAIARTGSLSDAVCWVGIPLGGVSAGAAIALVGLSLIHI